MTSHIPPKYIQPDCMYYSDICTCLIHSVTVDWLLIRFKIQPSFSRVTDRKCFKEIFWGSFANKYTSCSHLFLLICKIWLHCSSFSWQQFHQHCSQDCRHQRCKRMDSNEWCRVAAIPIITEAIYPVVTFICTFASSIWIFLGWNQTEVNVFIATERV